MSHKQQSAGESRSAKEARHELEAQYGQIGISELRAAQRKQPLPSQQQQSQAASQVRDFHD